MIKTFIKERMSQGIFDEDELIRLVVIKFGCSFQNASEYVREVLEEND